ncbi:MAG: hypothetical protein INH41_17130 [Myxococcaceae bacterium]|nr:hypothetical protein [Myxococcaceae bacterium]
MAIVLVPLPSRPIVAALALLLRRDSSTENDERLVASSVSAAKRAAAPGFFAVAGFVFGLAFVFVFAFVFTSALALVAFLLIAIQLPAITSSGILRPLRVEVTGAETPQRFSGRCPGSSNLESERSVEFGWAACALG